MPNGHNLGVQVEAAGAVNVAAVARLYTALRSMYTSLKCNSLPSIDSALADLGGRVPGIG